MGRDGYSQSSQLSTLVGKPVSRYTQLPKNTNTLKNLTEAKAKPNNRYHYSIYPEFQTEYQASYSQLTNLDFYSPIITILGDNPYAHLINTKFTDPGVSLDEGSTLVSNVSTVNTNAFGTFQITYVATDGINPDSTKVRIVKVGEFPVVTIDGDNPYTLERYDPYIDDGVTVDANSSVISTTSSVNNTAVGTYTVNYTVANQVFSSFHTRIVNVVDTTPPVVTILGDNPYTLERFDVYTDPGATGDLGSIVTTDLSNVQNTSIGTFVVVYNATDGNTAHDVAVTRTVNVVDTLPPVVTILGDNPYTLERFDIYTDPGANVDIGSILTTDLSNVNNATAHGGSFTIVYTATDGNTAHDVTVTRTVNIKDTKPPQLTILGADPYPMQPYGYFPDLDPGVEVDLGTSYSINYSNINNNNVNAGYQTVVYTASDGVHPDVVKTRVVAVADTVSPIITITGDNPYTLERYAEYVDEGATVDAGSTLETANTVSTVDNTTVGSYTVTYSATDNINPDTIAKRIVNVVDTTAPIVTLNGASSVILERYGVFADIDEGVDIDANGILVSVDTSQLDNTTQGTYTVTYNVVDDQENANVITREVVVVDTVPPVVSLVDPNTTYVLERYGVWADIDPGVTFDEGSYLHEVIVDNTSIGVETVEYVVRDGTNQTVKTRDIVISDTTPPVITITDGPYITTERFGTYVDPGATADDGSFITNTDRSNVDTSGAHNSTFDVVYTATDQGGNFSTAVRTVTVIDTVPPVITITDGASITTDGFTEYIDPGATVDQGSTLISTDLSNVDTTLLHGSTFDVVYTAYDGNSTTTAIRTVTVVDITPPLITMTGGPFITTQRFVDYVDPGATVDAGSTLISTDLSNVDTTLPHNSLFDVVYYATDEAGNSNTAIRTVVVKDGTAPIATLNGASTFIMERFDSWADVDPGIELDVGSYITSISSFDNTAVGTYTVTYNLSDDVNSNTITRTVIVSDTTPPVANLVSSVDVLEQDTLYIDPGITDLDVGSYLANTDLSNVDNTLPHESQFDVIYDIGDGNVYQNLTLSRTVTVVDFQEWTQDGNIVPSQLVRDGRFGYGDISVSSDGTYAVIGYSYLSNSGAFVVIVRSNGSWSEQQLITGPAITGYQREGFGAAVSIASSTKDYIAVGASLREDTSLPDYSKGMFYIYKRTNSSWSLQASFSRNGSSFLGGSVSLNGDGTTLAVGESGNATVHIYNRSGSTWTLHTSFTKNYNFGYTSSMSADGTLLAVGNGPGFTIYTLSNNTWSEQTTITKTGDSYFGRFVKMSSDKSHIMVSSNNNVKIYARDGTNWYLQGELGSRNAYGYMDISDGGKFALINDNDGNGKLASYARTGNTWYFQKRFGEIATFTGTGISGNGLYAFQGTPYVDSGGVTDSGAIKIFYSPLPT